jgi:hypothetical protein
MGILDLCDGGIPWSIVPGNHDKDTANGIDYPIYRSFFGSSRWAGLTWFGGASEEIPECTEPNRCEDVNTFQKIDIGGPRLLLHVGVEYDNVQVDELPDWANGVIAQHSDLPAMITTHSHARRTGSGCEAPSPVGDDGDCGNFGTFANCVIDPNPNVFFVASGHWTQTVGECEGERTNDADKRVVELYANYQTSSLSPHGWLRYCTFDKQADAATCETYSPLQGEFRGEDDEFCTTHTALGLRERLGLPEPDPIPPPPVCASAP